MKKSQQKKSFFFTCMRSHHSFISHSFLSQQFLFILELPRDLEDKYKKVISLCCLLCASSFCTLSCCLRLCLQSWRCTRTNTRNTTGRSPMLGPASIMSCLRLFCFSLIAVSLVFIIAALPCCLGQACTDHNFRRCVGGHQLKKRQDHVAHHLRAE